MIRELTLCLFFWLFTFRAQAQNPPRAGERTTGTPILVDTFDSVTQWAAVASEGVGLTIHPDSGLHGRSMRLDFDFHGREGWVVAHRVLRLDLPMNYEFSFAIRGEGIRSDGSRSDAPSNTLEFKLVDSTGASTWWARNPNFNFASAWQTVIRRKRNIHFAWGPVTDKNLKRVGAIDFAITAGSGGKGRVWLDDLTIVPLDSTYTLTPSVTATSNEGPFVASRVMDGNFETAWRSGTSAANGSSGKVDIVDVDFLKSREFGGVMIEWESGRRSRVYSMAISEDGQTWTLIGRTLGSSVPRTADSFLFYDGLEGRYLRLMLTDPEGSEGFGIREIEIKPIGSVGGDQE